MVQLHPGDPYQTIVDGNPPGTVYQFDPTPYTGVSILPHDGDTFLGQYGVYPLRTLLDGQGSLDTVFKYDDAIRHPQRVTLRSFAAQSYHGYGNRGMIFAENTVGWVLQDLDLRYAAWRAVDAGPEMTIAWCLIGSNGVAGVNGFQADDLIIRNSEFFLNNTTNQDPDTSTGEAAGIKLGTCRRAFIVHNHVHDNIGMGIWLDGDCHDCAISDNLVTGHTHRGIYIEISDTILVEDNHTENNGTRFASAPYQGYGGITIASSSSVRVFRNRLRETPGFGFFTTDPGTRGSGPYGPHSLRYLDVHGNRRVDP